jgi:hypothetical protein
VGFKLVLPGLLIEDGLDELASRPLFDTKFNLATENEYNMTTSKDITYTRED